MDAVELQNRFLTLTTAHVADACLRAGVPVRCGPAGMRPMRPGTRVAGRALPAQHVGSVDVFLEALMSAQPGDVLVVDNGGRLDEACVGDLVVQEAAVAKAQGVVVWGLHRDTADITAIGLPVFSLGALPTGPQRLDPQPGNALEVATVGEHRITSDDDVLGDDDGVLFIPTDRRSELIVLAEGIRDTERRQGEQIRVGTTLREQVDFDRYLAARTENPALTFRQHLRTVGGAIEE